MSGARVWVVQPGREGLTTYERRCLFPMEQTRETYTNIHFKRRMAAEMENAGVTAGA